MEDKEVQKNSSFEFEVQNIVPDLTKRPFRQCRIKKLKLLLYCICITLKYQ